MCNNLTIIVILLNSNIYNDGIKVGIGTTLPDSELDVHGTITTHSSLVTDNGAYFAGGNGDVNDDSIVSKPDADLIDNYLTYGYVLTPRQYAAADIDGDGKVTYFDYNSNGFYDDKGSIINTGEEIKNAVKKLWETGMVSDVQIYISKSTSTYVDLEISDIVKFDSLIKNINTKIFKII